MPGQTGTIDVKYNTNNVGGFSKTVTVTSNAVDNPRVVLRIKGNVKQDATPDTQDAKAEKKELSEKDKAKVGPEPVKAEPKVKPMVAEPAKIEIKK